MTERPHGNARYVRDGCRCDTCRQANARRVAQWQIRTRYGARPDYVPIDPVRAHAMQLRASGWTVQELATETGYSFHTVKGITANRTGRTRVRRDIADAILTVEPLPAPADVVDPIVVERLCADPTAWRHGLTSTRAERLAAAHILGAWSHKALGYSGSDAKRGAA